MKGAIFQVPLQRLPPRLGAASGEEFAFPFGAGFVKRLGRISEARQTAVICQRVLMPAFAFLNVQGQNLGGTAEKHPSYVV